MKKIYSLLALFLLLMGTATSAVAQQALATGYYRIKNAKTVLFDVQNPCLTVGGSSLALKAESLLGLDEDVWFIQDMGRGTDGKTKYTIKHANTGYYMVEGPSVVLDKNKQRYYSISYNEAQGAYTFGGHKDDEGITNKAAVTPTTSATAFGRDDSKEGRFWHFISVSRAATQWEQVTSLDQLVDGGVCMIQTYQGRKGFLFVDQSHKCQVTPTRNALRVTSTNVQEDANALTAADIEKRMLVVGVSKEGIYKFKFASTGSYIDNTERTKDGNVNKGDAVHAVNNPEEATFTIEPGEAGAWRFKSTVQQQKQYLNTGGLDNGGLVLFAKNDRNAQFKIYRQVTTVPVRQSDNNTYATFYSDAEVVLPAGVTAYTAKEMETTVQLTAMTGNVLPANTGVLLEAAADVQTVALAHAKTNAPALTGNDFKGVTTATEIGTRNVYVFGKGSKGLGFYKPSATTLKAHAAFIESTSTQASLALSFGGEQTGVEAVETTLQSDAPIYDLSGRRVTKAVKGVYIQGGKKIYIK